MVLLFLGSRARPVLRALGVLSRGFRYGCSRSRRSLARSRARCGPSCRCSRCCARLSRVGRSRRGCCPGRWSAGWRCRRFWRRWRRRLLRCCCCSRAWAGGLGRPGRLGAFGSGGWRGSLWRAAPFLLGCRCVFVLRLGWFCRLRCPGAPPGRPCCRRSLRLRCGGRGCCSLALGLAPPPVLACRASGRLSLPWLACLLARLLHKRFIPCMHLPATAGTGSQEQLRVFKEPGKFVLFHVTIG